MSVFDSAVFPHFNVPRKGLVLHPYMSTTEIGGATHAPVAKRACRAENLAPRQFAPECSCSIFFGTTRQHTAGCNDLHNYDVRQQSTLIKCRGDDSAGWPRRKQE